PASLAGKISSAIVTVRNAREVTAARVDGHSITAEAAANPSRGGGSY
ncbi:hypothetical protein N301_13323, partial [Charadrius vociferus]